MLIQTWVLKLKKNKTQNQYTCIKELISKTFNRTQTTQKLLNVNNKKIGK